MLEFIAIFFLCRKCSRTARAKGYKGGWFAFMAAGLWVGLEFCGIIIGALLVGVANIYLLYGFGLIGAGAGSAISLVIVNGLRQKPAAHVHAAPVGTPGAGKAGAQTQRKTYCSRCGSPIPEGGKFCVKCGTAI